MWWVFVALAGLATLVIAVPALVVLVAAAHFIFPWLLFGLGFWLLVSLGGGPRHRRARYGYRGPVPVGPARPQPRPQPQPRSQPQPQPQPRRRPDLPIDVQVKVEQIRRKAEMLQGYATRFPPFSRDLYTVRQVTREYLPRTIEAYLALPPEQLERPLGTSGKTALQELKEQLELLDRKLDEIAEDLQRQDTDRLLANRRFLEERFRREQQQQRSA
jgi:hypothetical protein